MDNNKKPSEPSEAERWALKNVPTAQLVAELSNREGVEATIAEPYQDAQLEQMISTGFTVGAALAAWWKNNSFTAAAIEGDKRMNSLKNQVH